MFKQFIIEMLIFATLATATVFSLYSDGKTISFVSYVLFALTIWISITFFKRMRMYFALLKFRMKNGYWCNDPVEFRKIMFELNEEKIIKKQLESAIHLNDGNESLSSILLKQILKQIAVLAFFITLFILGQNSNEKFLQIFSYTLIIAAIFPAISLIMCIYTIILTSVGSKPKK